MAKTKTLVSLPDGVEHPVRVRKDGSSFRVASGELEGDGGDGEGSEALVMARAIGPDVLTVVVAGRSYEALVERDDAEITVQVGPDRFRFGAGGASASGAARIHGGRQELKAPMPGKVVRLLVKVGDEVTAGQGVVLFEAMKMQNEIRSPGGGFVKEIPVQEGDAVEAKARLMVLDEN